ncbi:MAG: anti-sigma factor [Pirellulaceae bacterium]|nr:anti-sigma factor [Pirellulaceae bacterium]
MSEPAGWQWIEAWRNGTISDGDFHSLQILLREQSEARRTLRRSMAMDTALRDRAEARLLAAESETASDEKRASPVTAPRFRVVRREVVAWSAAAVCLLLAVFGWSRKPASDPSPGSLHNQPVIAQPVPVPPPATDLETQQPHVAPTTAQLRDQLLASAPDVLHIRLVSGNESAAEQARGEIVWSRERQLGYLCLRGLPRTEPSNTQYQLWIVDAGPMTSGLVDGGVFNTEQEAGELILPIQGNFLVPHWRMLVISVETPGGGLTGKSFSLLARAE